MIDLTGDALRFVAGCLERDGHKMMRRRLQRIANCSEILVWTGRIVYEGTNHTSR